MDTPSPVADPTTDPRAVTVTSLQPRQAVRITGRHRLRFLHAMTSSGLLKAAPGDARFATMSTAAGKHLGQMSLEVSDDHLTLSGLPGSVPRVLAGLAAHRVADDVRWGAPVARRTLVVQGPDHATVVAVVARALGLEDAASLPAPGHFVDLEDVRISAWEAVASEVGQPLVRLEVAEADGVDADAVTARLGAALVTAGADAGTEGDWEQQRILTQWPDDARDLPEEESTLASPRLVANVDWQKGCVLGQEAFVMARDRGAAPRRLCALRVSGAPPEPGAAILRGDDVIGRVGSVAIAGATAVLLTVLRRKIAEDPQDLRLEDGRPLSATAA